MAGATLDKNEEILLDLKESARRRIICGLRWDPMQDSGQSETLSRHAMASGGAVNAHDLDVLCLCFDKFGRFMEAVTGEEGNRTGDSGNIYHTGDVIDGADTLDDEQISLELFNMSSKVHQVFFIAEVQSAHNFGDTENPEIRLANASSDEDFAHAYLDRGAGKELDAFVFGCIRRHSQGWTFRYIGDYYDGDDITDWTQTLSPYIEAQKQAEGGKDAPPVPAEKQTVPLHYSKEARHRVVCGLNWDPLSEDVDKLEKLKNMGKNIESFDLDLACVMYDEEKQPVDGVSAKPDENIDSSGKVYHSGDDTSGEGDRVDDEAISVELKDLPAYIHHIVFLSEIQSLHAFDDTVNPTMRIADGKTNDDQLLVPLDGPEGTGKNAYVFARISRQSDGWGLTFINEFVNGEEVEDWIEYLGSYLA